MQTAFLHISNSRREPTVNNKMTPSFNTGIGSGWGRIPYGQTPMGFTSINRVSERSPGFIGLSDVVGRADKKGVDLKMEECHTVLSLIRYGNDCT